MSDLPELGRFGRFQKKMEQVAGLMGAGMFRSARAACEQALSENPGIWRGDFEQQLCRCMVKTGDPAFTRYLHRFKAGEQIRLKIIFAFEWGRDEELEELVLDEEGELDPMAFLKEERSGATRISAASNYAAMLCRRFEAGAAFQAAMDAAAAAKKRGREMLASQAFYAARMLGSVQRAEEALRLEGEQDRREDRIELDILKYYAKEAERAGGLEKICAEHLAGRLASVRPAFRLHASAEELPDVCVGGYTDYDDKELKEQGVEFFAQLDLGALPDPACRQKKVLRIWLRPEAANGGPGLHPGAVLVRSLSKPKPWRTEQAGSCPTFSASGWGFRFIRGYCLPDLYERDFPRPSAALSEPEQVLEPFRPESNQALGWPRRSAWAVEQAPEHTFNLLQICIGEVDFGLWMRPEDFEAGNFGSVLLVKGRFSP